MAKQHPNSAKNLKPAKKGEVRNPNGRPKKILTKIVADIKEEGYELVKVAHVQEAYEALLGLDKMKLMELWKDDEQPIIIQTVARYLLSPKDAFEIIEKMLDRAHGKATQNTSVSLTELPMPKIEWDEGDS